MIVLNALLFMHKVKHFPSALPISLRETIPENGPILGSTHETCEDWLLTYNNHIYRASIFYKCPLLTIMPDLAALTTPTSLVKISIYKNNAKKALLNVQAGGRESEWQDDNFILHNIPGLRRSARLISS